MLIQLHQSLRADLAVPAHAGVGLARLAHHPQLGRREGGADVPLEQGDYKVTALTPLSRAHEQDGGVVERGPRDGWNRRRSTPQDDLVDSGDA
jgi:hypothetical protein